MEIETCCADIVQDDLAVAMPRPAGQQPPASCSEGCRLGFDVNAQRSVVDIDPL